MSKGEKTSTSEETTPLIRIDEGATRSKGGPFDAWLREEFVDHADIPDEYRVIMRVAWDAGVAYMRSSELCPACGGPKRKVLEKVADPAPAIPSEWEYDELSAQEWGMYNTTPPPTDED